MGTSIEAYIPVTMADKLRKLKISTTPIIQKALREAIAAKERHIAWAEAECPEKTPEPVEPLSRVLTGNFSGENSEQIEENALKAAREVFGPDVDLRIVRDYKVMQNLHTTSHKFTAAVKVEAIEPLQLLTSENEDEPKLIATVSQRFTAKSVPEGVLQAVTEVRKAFGPEGTVRAESSSLGEVNVYPGGIIGSVNVKVYLP